MTQLPINIVEVGPRDGLQNEERLFSIEERVEMINLLSLCGFAEIEVGSFVSPKWVPQMAHSAEVFQKIKKSEGTRYSALVPNEKGLEEALAVAVKNISIFTAASETFNQKNINCSIDESFERFKPLVKTALSHGLRIRGYVSCVITCPYEGAIQPTAVRAVAQRLFDLGCAEISLGDTIGSGTPKTIKAMLEEVLKSLSANHLAIHCHDTYGNAIDNILVALNHGIRTIDSSISGLGGCPYAGVKAKGNVATELVVRELSQHGYKMTINTEALEKAITYVQNILR